MPYFLQVNILWSSAFTACEQARLPYFLKKLPPPNIIGRLSNNDGDGYETSLKKWICATLNVIALFNLVQFVKFWRIFLELNSKGLHWSSGKEKQNRCVPVLQKTWRYRCRRRLSSLIGTLRSKDATATRTSLKKWICVLSVFITIISTHLLCQM